jgi:hypothetical protein
MFQSLASHRPGHLSVSKTLVFRRPEFAVRLHSLQHLNIPHVIAHRNFFFSARYFSSHTSLSMKTDQSLHIRLRMGSIEEDFTIKKAPTKVLVIGGCYGGLSAALNLLDLCKGQRSRATAHMPDESTETRPKLAVEIKIVDERDGYCNILTSILVVLTD